MDIRVASWLSSQGHDVIHLRDQGLHRASDELIFQKARSEERILLTFDLDFNRIAFLTREKRASIILFRIQKVKHPEIIRRLQTILADSVEPLLAGCVVVVDKKQHRIRRLPLGEINPESDSVLNESHAVYQPLQSSSGESKRTHRRVRKTKSKVLTRKKR